MKKKIYLISIGFLFLLLTGCEGKEFINIKGDSVITHTYGEEYKDEGYELKDDKVTVTINNNVDINKIGEYQVTYIALKKDKEVERKIRVVKVIDNKAPEITLLTEAEVFLNSKLNDDELKKLVKLELKDNYDKMEDIKVELSYEIDTKVEGTYKVIIKAIDTNGNEAVAESTIKVSKIHITSIAFDKTSLKMNKGGNATLRVTYAPSNTNEDKGLTWTSNNESVAKVDNGKITAINHGKTKICAFLKVNTSVKQCIEVTVEEVHVTGINLDKTTVNLDVGKTSPLKATVVPSNTSDDKTIVWSSSNENVATVSGGKITAKSVGSSQVCATLKINPSIKKCATVNVNESDLARFKKYLLSIGFEEKNSNIYFINSSAGLETFDFANKTYTGFNGKVKGTYYYIDDKGTDYQYTSDGVTMEVYYNFKNENTTCYVNPSTSYSLCNNAYLVDAFVGAIKTTKNLFITYVEAAGVHQKNL